MRETTGTADNRQDLPANLPKHAPVVTLTPTLSRREKGLLFLSLLLLLASCGNLPQPFLGRPGATATRLAQPPPSRLAVLTPAQSLLPDRASQSWATAVAAALNEQEIPAVAKRGDGRGDWSLTLAAESRGPDIYPSYTIRNPAGVSQGVTEAPPIPTAQWAAAAPDTITAAAAKAAPGIATLLGRIEAARQQADPNSLRNRPTRVYFAGVGGAPGDGNTTLLAQMRTKLAAFGLVIQDDAKDADFTLKGDVATAPGAGGTMRIEIQWIVTDAGGERGRVLQLNEVPRGTLDRYWGDVAVAVASEASGGVRDVVLNATGKR